MLADPWPPVKRQGARAQALREILAQVPAQAGAAAAVTSPRAQSRAAGPAHGGAGQGARALLQMRADAGGAGPAPPRGRLALPGKGARPGAVAADESPLGAAALPGVMQRAHALWPCVASRACRPLSRRARCSCVCGALQVGAPHQAPVQVSTLTVGCSPVRHNKPGPHTVARGWLPRPARLCLRAATRHRRGGAGGAAVRGPAAGRRGPRHRGPGARARGRGLAPGGRRHGAPLRGRELGAAGRAASRLRLGGRGLAPGGAADGAPVGEPGGQGGRQVDPAAGRAVAAGVRPEHAPHVARERHPASLGAMPGALRQFGAQSCVAGAGVRMPVAHSSLLQAGPCECRLRRLSAAPASDLLPRDRRGHAAWHRQKRPAETHTHSLSTRRFSQSSPPSSSTLSTFSSSSLNINAVNAVEHGLSLQSTSHAPYATATRQGQSRGSFATRHALPQWSWRAQAGTLCKGRPCSLRCRICRASGTCARAGRASGPGGQAACRLPCIGSGQVNGW